MLPPSRLQGSTPTASTTDPSSTAAHCCCNFCTLNSLKGDPSEHLEASKHQGGGIPVLSPTAFKTASPQGLLLLLPTQPCSCSLFPAGVSSPNILLAQQHHSCSYTQTKTRAKATMEKTPKEHQAALHWEAAAEGHTLKSHHSSVLSLPFHVTPCELEDRIRPPEDPSNLNYSLIFFIYFIFKQGNETISEVRKQVPVVIRIN